MQFRHLLAGLGALFLLSGAAHAQPSGISQKVGVCDVKTPTNCIKPNADGSVNVNGGGGGSTFTAAAAPFAVTAGTTKPAGISTFNSGQWIIPVKPGTTTEIDLSNQCIWGLDAATCATMANPSANQLQTQADTVMVGGVNVKEINAVTPLMGNGATGTGSQRVTIASDNTPFATKTDLTTPGTTNAVVSVPLASAGMSTASSIAAANTTSVAVDASPGTLYAVRISNIGAAAWLKLYDAAQGSVTCGSGTPVMRILIPANSTVANGAGNDPVIGGGLGVKFSTAITKCITTGIADNDTTAPAASIIVTELDYK